MSSRAERAALPAEEALELAALEVVIGQCRDAAIAAGEALEVIRDKKLYRAAHKTFEAYCAERWGFGRSRGYRLIEAAVTAADLSPVGDICERHLRELSSFPPDMRQEILDVAQETAPGGKMTAAWIEQTGRRLIDARLAKIRAAREAAATAEGEEEDGEDHDDSGAEDDGGGEEEGAAPDDPPPAPSRGAQAARDAARHPVVTVDERAKLEAQAKRWARKGERLALALGVTPQDLLERFGG